MATSRRPAATSDLSLLVPSYLASAVTSDQKAPCYILITSAPLDPMNPSCCQECVYFTVRHVNSVISVRPLQWGYPEFRTRSYISTPTPLFQGGPPGYFKHVCYISITSGTRPIAFPMPIFANAQVNSQLTLYATAHLLPCRQQPVCIQRRCLACVSSGQLCLLGTSSLRLSQPPVRLWFSLLVSLILITLPCPNRSPNHSRKAA